MKSPKRMIALRQLQSGDCKVQKSNLVEGDFAFFNLQFAFYIKRLRLTGAYPSLDAISILCPNIQEGYRKINLETELLQAIA